MGKNEMNVLKTIGDIIDVKVMICCGISELKICILLCVLGMIGEEPKTVVGSVKVWTPTDNLVEEDSKLVYYNVP